MIRPLMFLAVGLALIVGTGAAVTFQMLSDPEESQVAFSDGVLVPETGLPRPMSRPSTPAAEAGEPAPVSAIEQAPAAAPEPPPAEPVAAEASAGDEETTIGAPAVVRRAAGIGSAGFTCAIEAGVRRCRISD